MQGKAIPAGTRVVFVKRVYGTPIRAGDKAFVMGRAHGKYLVRFTGYGNTGMKSHGSFRLRCIRRFTPVKALKAEKKGTPVLRVFAKPAEGADRVLSLALDKLVALTMERNALRDEVMALREERRKLLAG